MSRIHPALAYQIWRQGLQHYWPLDAASVSDRLYGSGGPRDLTAVNTPTSAVGPSGLIPLATQLTAASSQKFTLTSDASLHMGNKRRGFTCAAWVYADTLGSEIVGIFGKDGGVNSRDWRLVVLTNSTVNILGYDGTNNLGHANAGTLTTTTWYRVVLVTIPTVAGDRTIVYLNGISQGGQLNTYAAEWGATSQGFNLGQDVVAGSGRFWNGRICQCMIFHRAWSAKEVLWDYNNGLGRDYTKVSLDDFVLLAA